MKLISYTTTKSQSKQKKLESCANTFEKLFISAVDKGFSSLGENSEQAIYLHLENAFNIKKQEIPYKIKDFVNAIEQIFGQATGVIEIRIMKELYESAQNFTYFPTRGNLSFREYVAALRYFYQRNLS